VTWTPYRLEDDDALICDGVQVISHRGVVYLEVGHSDGALQSVAPLRPADVEQLVEGLLLALQHVKRSRAARAGTRAALKSSKTLRGRRSDHGPP